MLDQLFRCTVIWLAPMLCFTAEEAWAARYGAEASSVHLELFPEVPAAWRDDALAEKWRKVRMVRRVVTGALEIERAGKRIGSSLEAHPIVHVSDEALFEAVVDIDLAEICITSAATLVKDEGPADAFRLPDVAGVAVVPNLAEGTKCARSWKVLTTIGADPRISRRLAARRQGAARMGNPAQGGGVNARQSALRPAHPLRRGRRCSRLRRRPGQQALSAQGVRPRRPRPDPARAVLRSHPHPQHRHQLRPVPDRRAARPWVLLAVKAAAVVLLWVWLAHARDRLTALSLGLIIGGAVGNAIDRLAYGWVADFVYFHVSAAHWRFNWYVFNLADVAIVAGVIGLLYEFNVRRPRRKSALIGRHNRPLSVEFRWNPKELQGRERVQPCARKARPDCP